MYDLDLGCQGYPDCVTGLDLVGVVPVPESRPACVLEREQTLVYWISEQEAGQMLPEIIQTNSHF